VEPPVSKVPAPSPDYIVYFACFASRTLNKLNKRHYALTNNTGTLGAKCRIGTIELHYLYSAFSDFGRNSYLHLVSVQKRQKKHKQQEIHSSLYGELHFSYIS